MFVILDLSVYKIYLQYFHLIFIILLQITVTHRLSQSPSWGSVNTEDAVQLGQ